MKKSRINIMPVLALFFALLQFPASINAQAETGNLIIHDTFNDLSPFTRESGYHEITVVPHIGPNGTLRYWHPGQWISGASNASHIAFSLTGGKFYGDLSINYNGSYNGSSTHDVIAYPLGPLMSPEEGAIEFWYKPHFNQNDTSGLIYLVLGTKKCIDSPNNVFGEIEYPQSCSIGLSWSGWWGRKYWTASIAEYDINNNSTFSVRADTPNEFSSGWITFNKDEWLHFGMAWKHDGIDSYGNKTLLLFMNGEEVASSAATFSPQYSFNKYLVLGGSMGCNFLENSPIKCYCGASGDIDNFKVWDYAKTDFSDRFTEYSNNPPVADAGLNLIILSEDQDFTTIQGTATDLDNDPLLYRWLEGETVLFSWANVGANGEAYLDLSAVPYFLSIGQHTLTLEVDDGTTISADEMILTVDNSAPTPAPSGTGVYQINTPVLLGGQVSDFDGDLVSCEWVEGEISLFSEYVQTIHGGSPCDLQEHVISDLNMGIHILTLRVNDGVNNPVESDIEVEIIDTTDPTLAPVADKMILWPPNHKMVDITIWANASDNSGGPVILSLTIESNEPQNGLGDGDESPDWTEASIDNDNGVITFQLRAERSGSGNGRIYTITVTATDETGNSSDAEVEIIVPHDKSNR
ncbi:MAG: hypothetical protein HF982_08615 [Desulfobacteraceae bacterium]|nr:hypothetical protein [Desulfobacteraceae bacterium]MBC2719631.1 hypothetical protein [Desulfobacteraceae bacterium]